jgi:hypothetical protein
VLSPRALSRAGFVGSSNASNARVDHITGEAVKYIVLDFSAINDIDVSGGVMIVKTIEYLEARFQLRVLLASVKGSVRDSLWRSAGGIEISADGEISPVVVQGELGEQDDSIVDIVKIEDPVPAPAILSSRFFLGVPFAVDFAKRKLLLERTRVEDMEG